LYSTANQNYAMIYSNQSSYPIL